MKIDEERREQLIEGLQSLYLTEFEEELSRYRAESLLDHLAAALAPTSTTRRSRMPASSCRSGWMTWM